MSADIKLPKAEITKIIQSGWILSSLISKIVGPLMKVAVPLVKSNLAPLGVTVAASAGIQKNSKELMQEFKRTYDFLH